MTSSVLLVELSDNVRSTSLLPDLQSAYRRCRSTETAVLKVVADLFTAADCDEVTLLSLLDLLAAFDTVDHDILIDRLYRAFGSAMTFCHGSQALSLVVHRGSVSEASTPCTLQSSTVCRRAVFLDRSCSCCRPTPLMCSSSLHVTVSVSTRTLTTLSCTYIHRLTTLKQRLLVYSLVYRRHRPLDVFQPTETKCREDTVHLSRHAVSAGQSQRFRLCSQRFSCRSSCSR